MKNPPLRFPPKDQLTMGLHALQSLLLHAPERIVHVFADAEDKGKRKGEVLALCKEKKIPVSQVSCEILNKIADSDSHQSFVAHIKGRRFYSAAEFLENVSSQEKTLVLGLDQIFDPQNFGAILRSAECLGASGVMWSKNRGSDLTPVVAKTSSGASEWIPLIRISNLAEAASQFQKEGFEVVSATVDPKAEDAFSFSFSPKTLLILGSEGEGIQPLILKRSDRLIFIPMQGKIESLNVAQTAVSLLTLFHKKDYIN